MQSRARLLASTVVAAMLGLLLAVSPASAECDSDAAIFEDDFEFLDVTWGDPHEAFYVEDGQAIIEGFSGQVNFTTQNHGANVCVDMTIVEAEDIPGSPIGLVFWWEDWDNHYKMFYWADGYIEVRRVYKGNETYLFTEETLALKKGVGETNHVELVLRPKDATVIINGTEVKRFKGRQPKDGGVVGFYGASSEEQPAIFAFDNLVVSELADGEE